jgi:predicted ester cyclase
MVDDAYVGHQSAMTFGNAEVKAGHTALRKAMPDLKLTAEEVIVAGDKLILRMVWKGTFTGEYMGKPPTGKQVTNWSINIWRIKDGKIVEEWCQGDDLALMKQLGVLP